MASGKPPRNILGGGLFHSVPKMQEDSGKTKEQKTQEFISHVKDKLNEKRLTRQATGLLLTTLPTPSTSTPRPVQMILGPTILLLIQLPILYTFINGIDGNGIIDTQGIGTAVGAIIFLWSILSLYQLVSPSPGPSPPLFWPILSSLVIVLQMMIFVLLRGLIPDSISKFVGTPIFACHFLLKLAVALYRLIRLIFVKQSLCTKPQQLHLTNMNKFCLGQHPLISLQCILIFSHQTLKQPIPPFQLFSPTLLSISITTISLIIHACRLNASIHSLQGRTQTKGMAARDGEGQIGTEGCAANRLGTEVGAEIGEEIFVEANRASKVMGKAKRASVLMGVGTLCLGTSFLLLLINSNHSICLIGLSISILNIAIVLIIILTINSIELGGLNIPESEVSTIGGVAREAFALPLVNAKFYLMVNTYSGRFDSASSEKTIGDSENRKPAKEVVEVDAVCSSSYEIKIMNIGGQKASIENQHTGLSRGFSYLAALNGSASRCHSLQAEESTQQLCYRDKTVINNAITAREGYALDNLPMQNFEIKPKPIPPLLTSEQKSAPQFYECKHPKVNVHGYLTPRESSSGNNSQVSVEDHTKASSRAKSSPKLLLPIEVTDDEQKSSEKQLQYHMGDKDKTKDSDLSSPDKSASAKPDQSLKSPIANLPRIMSFSTMSSISRVRNLKPFMSDLRLC